VDRAQRGTGGEVWDKLSVSARRNFPTPLACGESTLPIKGGRGSAVDEGFPTLAADPACPSP
jgi:hypothetical protein